MRARGRYDYDKQSKLSAMGIKPGAAAKKHVRVDAEGTSWEDKSLNEWPEGDTRLFVGNLGNEVTDDLMSRAFARYPSFVKAKVVRCKFSGKTKDFGFASFMDPFDAVKCMREMNGKYIGNRPVNITRSTWQDKEIGEVTSLLTIFFSNKLQERLIKELRCLCRPHNA